MKPVFDMPVDTTPLDKYLQQFAGHCVTLVGPLGEPLVEWACLDDAPATLAEPLIWVDGGVAHRRENGGAGFAVGDGDSTALPLDQYLTVDKNYSDLAYVLTRLPAHFTEVVLLGFLGGRRDHELFNLGEVHHFLAIAKVPTRVRFGHRITAYSKGKWRFEYTGAFSLAVLEATAVALRGACRYSLGSTRIAPLSSRGLSNYGTGEITLTAQGPTFIFAAECD